MLVLGDDVIDVVDGAVDEVFAVDGNVESDINKNDVNKWNIYTGNELT